MIALICDASLEIVFRGATARSRQKSLMRGVLSAMA